MKYIFASENKKKYNEMLQMFPKEIHHENMKITEIQDNIENIVLDKVEKAYNTLKSKYNTNICVICDDVGLEISAINNLPGPYIKYFLKIGKNNFKKIVENRDNTARAVCAVGICFEHQGKVLKESFIGRAEGELVFSENENDCVLNFDDFFMPKNSTKTYAKMTLEEKNQISHRHVALTKLYEYMQQLGMNLAK